MLKTRQLILLAGLLFCSGGKTEREGTSERTHHISVPPTSLTTAQTTLVAASTNVSPGTVLPPSRAATITVYTPLRSSTCLPPIMTENYGSLSSNIPIQTISPTPPSTYQTHNTTGSEEITTTATPTGPTGTTDVALTVITTAPMPTTQQTQSTVETTATTQSTASRTTASSVQPTVQTTSSSSSSSSSSTGPQPQPQPTSSAVLGTTTVAAEETTLNYTSPCCTAAKTQIHTRPAPVSQTTSLPKDEFKPRALSSASVAAIVCAFIVIVLILFGGAYYIKIRRASYGRLRNDGEYGSVGNFTNPMYDP